MTIVLFKLSRHIPNSFIGLSAFAASLVGVKHYQSRIPDHRSLPFATSHVTEPRSRKRRIEEHFPSKSNKASRSQASESMPKRASRIRKTLLQAKRYKRPSRLSKRRTTTTRKGSKRTNRRSSRRKSSASSRTSFTKRILDAIAPTQTFSSINPVQCTSAVNQCSYSLLPQSFSVADVTVMFLVPGLSTANSATHIVVENVSMEIRMVNSDNAYADCQLYFCYPRRDISAALPTPLSVIAGGFLTAGYTAGSTDPAQTLFQSPDFTTLYKIGRTSKFRLLPGQEKLITYKGKSRRIAKEYQVTSNFTYLHNQSMIPILRVMGQPSNDVTTKTSSGYSGAKVNTISTERYTFRYNQPLVPQHVNVNSLGAMAAGAEFIEEKSGVVAAEVQA